MSSPLTAPEASEEQAGTLKNMAKSDNEAWLYGRLPRLLVAIMCFAVVAPFVALAVYSFQFSGGLAVSHSRWGEFGDFLGGTLNPSFGLLGLAALLLTILLQSRELRNSTRELAHSVRALDEQSASLKLQNFEKTFFEMVRLHHDIIKDLDLITRPGKPATLGRDCFRVFFDRLKSAHSMETKNIIGQEQQTITMNAYAIFYSSSQHEIGHYFRNFHRILKFVDESDEGTVTNKTTYTGILRAQMSSFELALLFYDALHPIGAKLKPLVERYSMLENLNLALVCNPSDEIRLFDKSAYGEQDVSSYYQSVQSDD